MRRLSISPAPLALAALGVGLGLTQAVHGLYDETTWGPVALATFVLLMALGTGTARRISLSAALPLLGLAVWSLLSSSWGESAESAWSEAALWLLYAAALPVMLWLLGGDRRRAQGLILGVAGGALAVAIWLLGRMLVHHGASLFLGSRLNDPLGYVDGQAAFLLAGVWPCCALAEQRRSPWIAGAGLGGCVLLIGIGFLAQSRSWEVGLAASTVLMAATCPGRRRRITIIIAVAIAMLAIRGPLGDTYTVSVVSNHLASRAAAAIGLTAVIAGIVWAAVTWGLERLAPTGGARRLTVQRWGSIGLVALAVITVALVGVRAERIARTVRADYHQFVHLAPRPQSARFFAGGGNRYDYWRVAWLEFRGHPLAGVGAGSYSVGYYQHRRTTESITQPHSIELQTLAELGLVGLALLVAFVVAAGRAFSGAARRARSDPASRFIAVSAGGTFAGWLSQTSVDWEHLIPGITLIALAAVAVLLTDGDGPARRLAGRARVIGIAAAAVIAGLGAIVVGPRILALQADSSATAALRRSDTRGALADATRALRYDGDLVDADVLRSAALSRLDAFQPALAELQQALRTEPDNWSTWALLGDLLSRRGDLAGARAAYQHALRLNPLEPELAAAIRV